MFGFLNMAFDYEQRNLANTKVDGGVVDTSAAYDSPLPYETGIQHPAYRDNENWIIVEGYATKEEALVGHDRWVELMKTKPPSLTDVSKCEVAEIAEAFQEGLIRKTYPRKEVAL